MSDERERQAEGIRSTRVGFASALGAGAAEQEPEPEPPADSASSVSQDTIPAGTGRHTIVSARFGGVAPAAPPPERTRLRLIAGKIIPGTRYRLIRWLGEGGMGVVYEAEHIDIERHVALKILRYDLSQQPEMAQVFRDEARAASRMGHANIVEVFDFGELPDGRLFFCMELLVGKDLVPDDDQLRTPAELVAILRQLCKGLAAAHRQGIVHRDIKPENIILVKRGGREGVVKLVDFGISAMLAADTKDASDRITGTPHYMAPEQIQGHAFDGRLDMYAVGCVAYELLTGCAPFPGEVVEEVLLAQIDNPPRPPCSTDKGAATPPALEAVILRCLEKRPEDRYADMNDLEAALCEAQIAAGLRTEWDDLPLPDVDPERVARLRRQMPSPHAEPTHRRWLLPVAIATSLAAGVAVTFALIGGEPTPQARSEVDRIAEEALAAASLTNYVAPPPDDPAAPTAYQKVLALEALEGSAEAIADERALELRKRFSTGLLALGDKYWDVARPFATEYYIWARTFDPDNERAVLRSGLSLGSFVAFQGRAARGEWQEGELRALLLVGALAEDDEGRRQSRVEQALASNVYSPRDEVAFDQQLRSAGIRVPPPRRRPEPPPPPRPPPEPDPVDELMPVPLPEDSTLPPDVRPGKKPVLAHNRRDPKRARALADEGNTALRAGKRTEAENLFHQAIAYDNRNVRALMGLSDVYFDTGAKQKSLQFAELAVEAAPQSRASNLKLGDAYYNVLRYRDALRHYKKAQELGETSAQGRIDKVTARIGG
jgi:serine/threonine protein kinase/tetratricopeptide (TPR) repeat protein